MPNQPTQPDIFHKPYDGNGVIFSFEVKNIDSAYAEVKRKSFTIILELSSEDWRRRHFCVKDPNEIYLDIVQSIESTEEYQQGYETK